MTLWSYYHLLKEDFWHGHDLLGYQKRVLYKHWRTNWNFEGFLGFCMQL